MRCEVCIKELWDDMSRKVDLLKELHSLVKAFYCTTCRSEERRVVQ